MLKRLLLTTAVAVLLVCLRTEVAAPGKSLWADQVTSWAQTPDPLDQPFGVPQYLLHSKGHGTTSGGVEDDWWFLYTSPPKDGFAELPDGTGGTFTYAIDQSSGPFNTPREVCGAAPAETLEAGFCAWNSNQCFSCVSKPGTGAEEEGGGQGQKPEPTYNGRISLDPEVGPPEAQVKVSGDDFPPNTAVDLRWDGEDGQRLTTLQSDGGGGLDGTFSIPANTAEGQYTVYAVFQTAGGRKSASAPFEVRILCIYGAVKLRLRDGWPLQGVAVSLWLNDPNAGGNLVQIQDTLTGQTQVATDEQGGYRICSPRIALPSGFWLLRVRLEEIQFGAYDVRDEETNQPAQGFFGEDGTIGADILDTGTWLVVYKEQDLEKNLWFEDREDKAATQLVREDHALDAALIYYHLHQAMRVYRSLGVTFAASLPIWIYSEEDTAFDGTAIHVNKRDSDWNSGDAPKNREWHEFSHAMMRTVYGGQAIPRSREEGGIEGDVNGNHILDKDINHDGYLFNALNSSDAIKEGFAEAMAMIIADQMDQAGEPYMQDLLAPYLYTVALGSPFPEVLDFELNHPQNLVAVLPNETRQWIYDAFNAQRYPGTRTPFGLGDEENCVASLLWDLYDGKKQGDRDQIEIPLQRLWAILTASYTFPSYYDGTVVTRFLGDPYTYAGRWQYYNPQAQLGAYEGERQLNAGFPTTTRQIWYIRDLYDALTTSLPDQKTQIDEIFASHKITMSSFRVYEDYTRADAGRITAFGDAGSGVQLSISPQAAHSFWSQGLVADLQVSGWGSGFTINQDPAFDARGYLSLWVWINAPQGTTFDLVVEDGQGQWLCAGTSEAWLELGGQAPDLAPFQRGTGSWDAYSPPGMTGGPYPFVGVIAPSGGQFEHIYNFRPNPHYKTPPAGAAGPDVSAIKGIGVLFTSPGNYRAMVGAVVTTLDYPWKAGMRSIWGLGDPSQAMWLPYRRDHPPLPGSKALIQVDRVPATVQVTLNYGAPYQDLSFTYPLEVRQSPQEIWLYVEPPLDGQENTIAISAEQPGYKAEEVFRMSSTDYWTALGRDQYVARVSLKLVRNWLSLKSGGIVALACFPVLAVLVVAGAVVWTRRSSKRRPSRPLPARRPSPGSTQQARPVQPAQAPASGTLSVSRGQASRPALPLDRPVLTLGRSSDCDLILSDAQVSRHHAQIRRQDSGAVLVDLASSNGTFVNGRRIDAAYRLRPGDVLRLGNTQLLFELPGQPRRPAAGGGQLTLVRGKSEPANLALRPGVDVQIGRSRTNDVVIQDDPHVSRQHVRIRWTAQGAELLDLDSGAGVFVNGQQVKRARLQPGDRIRLSSTEFIFRGL